MYESLSIFTCCSYIQNFNIKFAKIRLFHSIGLSLFIKLEISVNFENEGEIKKIIMRYGPEEAIIASMGNSHRFYNDQKRFEEIFSSEQLCSISISFRKAHTMHEKEPFVISIGFTSQT